MKRKQTRGRRRMRRIVTYKRTGAVRCALWRLGMLKPCFSLRKRELSLPHSIYESASSRDFFT